MKYSIIAIIYNPRSTGNSRRAAQDLQRQLAPYFKGTPIKRLPTKYAGHAEELAYEIASKHEHPLIVSSSGDGGYHEVVNGAMRAQNEGREPICAVLPTGNANDHARTMHKAELKDLIIAGKVRRLDLLEVVIYYRQNTRLRYAHSYVGFGFTPAIAEELNSRTLNKFVEVWAVAKNLLRLRPVRLDVEGERMELDSLICSTIPGMAKILTIAKDAKPDDGIFETVVMRHSHKLNFFAHLFKGTFRQFDRRRQTSSLHLRTLSRAPMQLDGEVQVCKKGSQVSIKARKKMLKTLA